MTQHLKVRRN